MAKLKLDIDRLHVESFGTEGMRGGSRGTVHARSGPATDTCPPITVLALTCTCPPNSSVGMDCFCTESPTCWQCPETG